MIFFLILGLALGATTVVFILQNTDIVTVTFLSWQFQGSLSVVLFLAIITGVLITMLLLFPSFVKDMFALSSIRRKNKALEEELASTKEALAKVPTAVVVETPGTTL